MADVVAGRGQLHAVSGMDVISMDLKANLAKLT